MKQFRKFLLLNFGLILTAIGIAYFKAPNHFAFGGTSGISVLLASFFPGCNVGGYMWMVNAVLVVLGFVLLGRRFFGWTVYSSFALSFYVTLLQALYPMSAPFTDDMMLEMIFAVILPAVGSALVFEIGASTGGTDIVAMILKHYTELPIGKSLFFSDIAIVVIALFRFGPRTGLYCILGIIGKTFIVDGVIESCHRRKVCTIISSKSDEIVDFILYTLNRSATISDGTGAYLGTTYKVINSCLTRGEALRLRHFIHTCDPKAFITIINSTEIVGKGFATT